LRWIVVVALAAVAFGVAAFATYASFLSWERHPYFCEAHAIPASCSRVAKPAYLLEDALAELAVTCCTAFAFAWIIAHARRTGQLN
jgi:hypothetical protein